jgi:signal transduction histidine kinase
VSFERASVAQKGLLILAIPLAFQLIFLALLTVLEAQHTVEGRSLADSARAESRLNYLIAQLHDAEAAMRGYVLTGDPRFDADYAAAEDAFRAQLKRVDDSVLASIGSIETEGTSIFRFHEQNRQLVAQGRPEMAVARVRTLEGKRLMGSAEESVRRLFDQEERRQVMLRQKTQLWQRELHFIIGGGMMLNVVVALLAGRFFTASIARRVKHVVENTHRLDHDEELLPLMGTDELAQLDVVYRRVANDLRERTRRLEEVNKQLEAFSYSVSHDLRAPVRAVGGYARMLEEDYGATLEKDARRYIEVIQQESDRMGRLIDDLLELSRLAAKPLKSEPVDVSAIAHSELTRLRAAEPHRNIDAEIADAPLAMGDREMLRSVIANLVGNAWKYTRGREQARIEFGGEPVGGVVRYFVRDNGAGFDMKYAAKLFVVFERLHSGDQFEGTGIGLAIVQKIVTRHGGTVWADSAPDQGATFFFTLPNGEETGNAG